MKVKSCCFTCKNWCSDYKGRFKARMCRKKGAETSPKDYCQIYFRDIHFVSSLKDYLEDRNYDKVLKGYVEE